MMKISVASLFLFSTLLLITSCDDIVVSSENEEKQTAVDNISGTWEMSGIKIYTMYCFGTCNENPVLKVD